MAISSPDAQESARLPRVVSSLRGPVPEQKRGSVAVMKSIILYRAIRLANVGRERGLLRGRSIARLVAKELSDMYKGIIFFFCIFRY